ncbi:major facilitator superfamily protein [Actinidia rufa]|uniref:Major facilitator superfamily protein n=1 Tax=Actinidia rufa TaxID=165716 RepID=A0A7J0FRW6_9ERIC|nr:major facilitator superfamily protein [Actinidia rufa]
MNTHSNFAVVSYQGIDATSSIVAFLALGGLLFGYNIGATSGATISLQSRELSGTAWSNLSAVQLGLAVSGSLYGALLGSLLVYPIADFLGRRRELIIAAVLYAFGGLITSNAPGLGVLLIGWPVYGLGIGLVMHGAPLYIAETCPSQIPGTLISLKELVIVLGILELLGGENLFLLFGAIALVSHLFVVFYVPETKGLSLEEIESKILK